jgi:hypothetical protein
MKRARQRDAEDDLIVKITVPHTRATEPSPTFLRDPKHWFLAFLCIFDQEAGWLIPAIYRGINLIRNAIAAEKPVIASRIPITEKLFSRFGNIGYLCADRYEFCETIETIIKRADVKMYANQVLLMREVRRSRTPQYLAPFYRDLSQTY